MGGERESVTAGDIAKNAASPELVEKLKNILERHYTESEIEMTQHIYPTNDLREHEMTPECWCKPKIEMHDDYSITITHNSMDERETYEEGRKMQ